MTRLIGHRGGSFLWPENGMRGFRAALDLGLSWVECDVHLAADGVPVVIHDATLERTTDRRGPVSALDSSALSAARLRGAGGEGVPRLSDLAALVASRPGAGLQVEIKGDHAGRPYPCALEAVLAELDRSGIRARSGVIAFEAGLAARAARAGGLDHAGWLFTGRLLGLLGAEGVAAVARVHGLAMVETEASALDAALLDRLKGEGLSVAAWGANHAPEIARLLALGADALATDDPQTALRLAAEGR